MTTKLILVMINKLAICKILCFNFKHSHPSLEEKMSSTFKPTHKDYRVMRALCCMYHPSVKALADEANMSQRACRRSLERLEKYHLTRVVYVDYSLHKRWTLTHRGERVRLKIAVWHGKSWWSRLTGPPCPSIDLP